MKPARAPPRQRKVMQSWPHSPASFMQQQDHPMWVRETAEAVLLAALLQLGIQADLSILGTAAVLQVFCCL